MADEVPRGDVLWTPSPERVAGSRLTDFARFVALTQGRAFHDYGQLHAWSVTDLEGFWSAVFQYFRVASPERPSHVVEPRRMPGARWFSGTRVNYACSALAAAPGQVALIACDETGARSELTYGELSRRVMACREGLARLGVAQGDRVAAYLPNCTEAVVAFLATASLGAIWSSCPPEFGTNSVLDRFSQIRPKVLLATDGYWYGGKWFERGAEVQAISEALDELQATVLLRRSQQSAPHHELDFEALCAHSPAADSAPDWVDFEHPLWILYSSGTTGKPKPIVHSHGGIILEHCKVLALHGDLGPADRFFWFSTTGWMMWNYLLGGLLVGASVVLYEGSPAHPDLAALWRLAETERLTFFGTSAPFLTACRTRGLVPAREADLASLRAVGSTGAPLSPEGFQWVYEHVSPDVQLASVSGGTDMCTAFVTSCPWLAVRSGELQCSALGAAVEAFDVSGRRVFGRLGELVITQPMPSMPLGFWGDDDGSRYRESYFEHYPGAWRHGDWIVQFEDGAAVIFGRSDATLNRGGVRMGTSEFYRALEDLPAISDSLVVELGGFGREAQLCLFVVTSRSDALDEGLKQQINAVLRNKLSPRHVPDRIIAVPEIPYTLSGKKLELPVKRILEGASVEANSAPGTQRNPEALAQLVECARLDGLGRSAAEA